jgi:hypothetical protein
MNNIINSDKQEIVEDVPQMRSVAMHSPMAIPLSRSFPLANKVAPSRLVVSEDDHKVVSTTASWKVNDLVHLPSMHLLERSNVYVSNTEPFVVAQRIAECLRSQSIAATFFDNEVRPRKRESVQALLTFVCLKEAVTNYPDSLLFTSFRQR